ncbi:MAG: MFS transporter [bacterium]|nr:MFS transporter [bacterium]MCY4272726.1 MFS transporter [bacterium]
MVFGCTMTIIGASLSDISESLDTSNAALSWAVSAPFLGLAAGTTVFGTIGDLWGHRRMLILGLTVFTAATGVCGLAWDAFSFIAFRALVGLGGAMMIPNGMAILMAAFPVNQRARAMGWFQFAAVGGPAIGLVTGGALVDALGWRAIFAVYTPIAAIGLIAAVFVVRPTSAGEAKQVDLAGAISLVAAVVVLMAALDRGATLGFAHPLALALLALVPATVWTFAAVERRTAHPMVPLEWFRRRNYAGPVVASAMANAAYMGGFILAPQLLQERYGYTLTAATVFLVVRLVSFSLSSPIGGRLVATRGERWASCLGSALVLLAMVSFAAGSLVDAVVLVILGLALAGSGLGVAGPAYQVSVVGAVPMERLGAATGMFQTLTSLGTAAGVQVLVLAVGESASGAAFARAFWLGAAVAAVGVFGALAISSPRSGEAK